MTDQSHVLQSSQLTADHEVATRTHRTADRMCLAGRRDLVALLAASGLAISTWALFPSTVESGIYVPLPEASTPLVADVNSAMEGVDSAMEAVAGSPVYAARWINAKLEALKSTTYGSVTLRYPSPVVNVSLVPLRSKLQALLMMLHSQSGDLDPAALEAKLQALLMLPDSVLAEVMQHPDLADLNKMLDAVFLGTSNLSGVKTELDKIDVTSVPGTSEQIQVIKVSGTPAYTVHSPALIKGTEDSAVSPLSAPPPPGEPMTMASQFEAVAGLIASAFTLAPSSEPLPPPLPPPLAPARLSAPALMLAPSSEQFIPPPAPTLRIRLRIRPRLRRRRSRPVPRRRPSTTSTQGTGSSLGRRRQNGTPTILPRPILPQPIPRHRRRERRLHLLQAREAPPNQVASQVVEAKPRRTTMKAAARARSLRCRRIAAHITSCSTTTLSGLQLDQAPAGCRRPGYRH